MSRGIAFPAVLGLVSTDKPMPAATNDTTIPAVDTMGLRFTSLGGPLVVVCGLHGGAGTSTLAYALAAQASQESPTDVLLCESDAASGDIARLTGVVSPLGLGELAGEFAAGRPPQAGTFARADRLRVVATAGAFPARVAVGEMTAMLDAARQWQGLTVVDAGIWRASGTRELLAAASHVVWVLAARSGAAGRARPVLAASPSVSAKQALVARGDLGGRKEAKALTELADGRCERLVLWEDSPVPVGLADRRLLSALAGLAGFLTTWASSNERSE